MTLEDQLRAMMRDDMLAQNLPAHDVDETLDLAFHAAGVATDKLAEICLAGSTGLVRENAFSLALSVAKMRVDLQIEKVHRLLESEGNSHATTVRLGMVTPQ